MPPEIDAEGIWQLVKDWPDEVTDGWWFGYAEKHPGGPTWYEQCGPVMPITAYWAMIGRGLAWLARQHKCPCLTYCDQTERCFVVHAGHTTMNHEHELAAVSAAVLAAAKGGA